MNRTNNLTWIRWIWLNYPIIVQLRSTMINFWIRNVKSFLIKNNIKWTQLRHLSYFKVRYKIWIIVGMNQTTQFGPNKVNLGLIWPIWAGSSRFRYQVMKRMPNMFDSFFHLNNLPKLTHLRVCPKREIKGEEPR